MNRKDFKSAYNKITLSDECRADMKKKLLAAMDEMEQKGTSADFTDDGLLHTTQEIKIAPRKRSAGKTAAIVGSAAAIIAVFAVGAGVMLSRNSMTQPPVNSTSTQESGEQSGEFAQTQESPETIETAEAQDDGNSIKTACGIMRFQELSETNAEHSEPGQQFADSAAAVTEMRKRWQSTREFSSLGWDQIYEQNHGIEKYEYSDGGDDITDTRPLGNELPYSDGYYSDTGMTLIYRSEDGTKQANLSISTVENEFIPITLPDGGYLKAVGDPESLFSRESYANFIDPEYDLEMYVGTYTNGADTYFTAYYYIDSTNPEAYVRIDAKNITRDQFIDCIAKNTYQYRIQDHMGLYNAIITGSYGFVSDSMDDRGFEIILPDPKKQETEWGTLNLNQLTFYYLSGDASLYNPYSWNVEYNQPVDGGDVPYYTLDEIPELTGVDMMNKLTLPDEFAAGSDNTTKLVYRAAYEGIYREGSADWAKDIGVNTEMLPGDDPEEFAEAQKYVGTSLNIDENGVETEDPDHYLTDKVDYFKNKKRTSFYADLIFKCGERKISVKVLDDWRMYGSLATFGRYPVKGSPGFISGAEGNGEVYAGWGQMNGDDVYLGGFKNADGRYVVLEARNVGCRDFTRLLAQLYTGEVDLPAGAMVRYPDYMYSFDYGTTIDSPIGHIWFNQAVLMDYTPGDYKYFTYADDAEAAEQSVLGRDFIKLMKKRGWVLQPSMSAILQTNDDGTPAGVSLYFDKGGKVARVNFGQYDRYSDLRIALSDNNKVLRVGGDSYESSITDADIFLEKHYFDDTREWQAGVCGMVVCGVPLYRFEVQSDIKPVTWSIDTYSADESDLMDIVAMALYGAADRNDLTTIGSKAGESIGSNGYEFGSELDTEYGYLSVNQLVQYPGAEFTTDDEQEISGEEVAEFIAANTAGGRVDVPFEADSVTKRTVTADGGYVSESVKWSQGDTKSLRIRKITNGDALTAYGEEFGPENILPYRTTISNGTKKVRIVIAGAKVPTGAYWLYAISDDGSGKYTTVMSEGLSVEEFVKVLADVYL